MHIAHHYTFVDKLLPGSFQTTVKISRVIFFQGGRLPSLLPRAGAHVCLCPHSFVFPWAVESSPLQFLACVTNLNEPPRALATSTITWVRTKELASSLLGRCKQKQRTLRELLCRWPSITEWEMHITAQDSRLRNDLYCVETRVRR